MIRPRPERRRSTLAVCAVIVTMTASASAQTTPFEGFYAGGSVGISSGSADVRMTTQETPTAYDPAAGTYFQPTSVPAVNDAGRQRIDRTAFAGSGLVGYNRVSGRALFGFELDVSSFGLDGGASTNAPYPCCEPNSFTITQSVDAGWIGTARGRAGYAAARWLAYGTGGVAFAPIEYRGTFGDAFLAEAAASHEDTRAGWAAGGGLEYAMASSRWSFAVRYLYIDLGALEHVSRSLTQAGTLSFPNAPFTHTAALRAHTFTAGVNRRF